MQNTVHRNRPHANLNIWNAHVRFFYICYTAGGAARLSYKPELLNNQHNFSLHWLIRENNTKESCTHHWPDVSILSLLTRRAGQTLESRQIFQNSEKRSCEAALETKLHIRKSTKVKTHTILLLINRYFQMMCIE